MAILMSGVGGGGMIFYLWLGYALLHENDAGTRDGRVVEQTYRDFPVLRYGEMPEVELHTVESDRPPTGATTAAPRS